jgi:hypothetical protein
MQMERIYPGGDVAEVRSRLLGDLEVEVRRDDTLRVVSDSVAEDLSRQLRHFASRAFRRPPTEPQILPYERMLREDIAGGMDPVRALRKAYRGVLCSPRFLYFVEPVGRLDDYAIASRLSYLFWNSMPDEPLMRLAAAGRLRDPQVIRAQVERMLEGNRCERFVRDFASQWLDLVDINFTDPDRKLYRGFDIVVQDAMLTETHRFLMSLIESDAPARRLIDCDYTFLNSRLARYYGIDGVQGDQVRQVPLDRGDHRGGLLAHGAILKVTADGTNTSPVLRGIWINERLLGNPIPEPPANVPAIEPDIRGATTIREMLEKHRSDAACASCHRKIDPPGFALENFDAAGRWRDRYLRVQGGRVRAGAAVDASYTLADGSSFDGFESFRKLVADEPSAVARSLVQHLLMYGTGAEITFADREVVDAIVRQTADSDYGVRSLIHAVVQSPVFLSK